MIMMERSLLHILGPGQGSSSVGLGENRWSLNPTGHHGQIKSHTSRPSMEQRPLTIFLYERRKVLGGQPRWPSNYICKIAHSIFTMDVNVSLIGGNVSTELKRSFFNGLHGQLASKGFEFEIARRTVWKEMSLLQMTEEPEKLEGRTVFEVTVEDGVCSAMVLVPLPLTPNRQDMVNPAGALHGGCSALLINRHVPTSQVVLTGSLL